MSICVAESIQLFEFEYSVLPDRVCTVEQLVVAGHASRWLPFDQFSKGVF